MKAAFQKDDVLLADIHASASEADAVHLWWLGQSGFLVRWDEKFLLMDPYLSDSLTKKYANTDKQHVRMTERCIAPEALAFVHVITSSHNHTDHLDAETLIPILKENPKVQLVIPEANRKFVAERLGISPEQPVGFSVGETKRVAGFEITAVPAAHNQLGPEFLGYVFRIGGRTIYHSGDTLMYEGMADRLRPFNVDIALLPINGDRPERRVAGNLNGREAASLAKQIAAKLVVPMHYDMFEFNTASPEEFVGECQRLDQAYRVMRCGERLSI
jgi:L-ascorbate metabolism protein UlaG (beta-lactamase superfamily)